MKFEAMFQPVKIGNMTVPNRFVMSPMGNNFANTDGKMSERSAAYYGARAKGGFGLITFEATVVYKEAKGGPRKPCLFSDDTVSNFKEAILACHKEGAKVSHSASACRSGRKLQGDGVSVKIGKQYSCLCEDRNPKSNFYGRIVPADRGLRRCGFAGETGGSRCSGSTLCPWISCKFFYL